MSSIAKFKKTLHWNSLFPREKSSCFLERERENLSFQICFAGAGRPLPPSSRWWFPPSPFGLWSDFCPSTVCFQWPEVRYLGLIQPLGLWYFVSPGRSNGGWSSLSHLGAMVVCVVFFCFFFYFRQEGSTQDVRYGGVVGRTCRQQCALARFSLIFLWYLEPDLYMFVDFFKTCAPQPRSLSSSAPASGSIGHVGCRCSARGLHAPKSFLLFGPRDGHA
jgi:hypothetical protein